MALKDDVATVFRDSQVQRIDFHLEGLSVTPPRLSAVGEAIRKERIRLTVGKLGSLLGAAYSPHQNTMALGSAQTPRSTLGRASIIHEGVHALVDLFRCTTITELTDEAAAYLAEVIYLRASHFWIQTSDAATQEIYKTANELCDRYDLGIKKGVRLKRNEYEPLQRVIHRHPAYRSIRPGQLTSGHGVP